jgi:hypothetical protein
MEAESKTLNEMQASLYQAHKRHARIKDCTRKSGRSMIYIGVNIRHERIQESGQDRITVGERGLAPHRNRGKMTLTQEKTQNPDQD